MANQEETETEKYHVSIPSIVSFFTVIGLLLPWSEANMDLSFCRNPLAFLGFANLAIESIGNGTVCWLVSRTFDVSLNRKTLQCIEEFCIKNLQWTDGILWFCAVLELFAVGHLAAPFSA